MLVLQIYTRTNSKFWKKMLAFSICLLRQLKNFSKVLVFYFFIFWKKKRIFMSLFSNLVINKTPLGETWPTLSLYWLLSSIQFFDSPHFPDTVSDAAWHNLLLTLQNLCDLQNTILRHRWPGTSKPTLT